MKIEIKISLFFVLIATTGISWAQCENRYSPTFPPESLSVL